MLCMCLWCVCSKAGVGCRGLKGIKVTRCNRMALRVYVCVCVCSCVLEPERTGAPSLAELFKLPEPYQGIFSLSRHAHSLTLSVTLCFPLPPPYTICNSLCPCVWVHGNTM